MSQVDEVSSALTEFWVCSGILLLTLVSASGVVLNRHEGELRTTAYWSQQLMSGMQEESIPLKGPLCVTDFHAVVESITERDLQLTLETLGLDDQELYTAIGQTVLPEGYEPPEDEVVQQAPVIGMRRGGALMNAQKDSNIP